MTATIDQQFIEYIVKSLVGKPEAVKIERRIDEKGVLLELTVDPEDLGRVIGKKGATAQSLRTLLRALGTKNEARYNLKIVDNGVPRPERTQDDSYASSAPKADDTDSPAADDTLADNPVEEPAESEMSPAASKKAEDDDIFGNKDEEPRDDNRGSLADRTRRELADLDDLDL